MKKLTAILLLALLLFNIIGYRVMFFFQQRKQDTAMEASFDKDAYNEADLLTVKINLSLPYETNWKDFERVDGVIRIEGKVYRYVKRRVFNGELILKCLPDEYSTRLQTARDDFFRLANNLSTTSSRKQGNTFSFKNILSYYDNQQCAGITFILPVKIRYSAPGAVPPLACSPQEAPGQPPDERCLKTANTIPGLAC
ncbi:MAG TPA: hypothetical protein VG738_22435 [Chitinophagaceae bacterium]|nr:hypothetical protein [Chitinophagaceae bacterium]